MKAIVSVAVICVLMLARTYGQGGDLNCPVTESWLKAQSQKEKGKMALAKTNATTTATAITGPQDLVILFVDYLIKINADV
jgi:hypothetical protein